MVLVEGKFCKTRDKGVVGSKMEEGQIGGNLRMGQVIAEGLVERIESKEGESKLRK